MIKLRMGIIAGAVVLFLLAVGLVRIPNDVWYPVIQLALFTAIIVILSPKLNNIFPRNPIITSILDNPIYALFPAGAIVATITFFQLITQESRRSAYEKFVGGERAMGRIGLIPPNPKCPVKLNFTHEDSIDSDVERQNPLPSCISDPNKLTEEQQLDEIDIYLRDAQETIARITSYLNVAKPDERWLSKKEMDDPENARLEAKNFTLVN